MRTTRVRWWLAAALGGAALSACTRFEAAGSGSSSDAGGASSDAGGDGGSVSCTGALYCETFDDKGILADLEHDDATTSSNTDGMSLTASVGERARGLRLLTSIASGYFERRVLVTKNAPPPQALEFAFDLTATAGNGLEIAGLEMPLDPQNTAFVRLVLARDNSLSAEVFGQSGSDLGSLGPGTHRLAFEVDAAGACRVLVDGVRKSASLAGAFPTDAKSFTAWYGLTGDSPATQADLQFDNVRLGSP